MRAWFARWFGGRKVHDDDEPRYAQPSPRPVRSVKGSPQSGLARSGSSKIGTAKRGIHADKVADKVKSGFDPYNSGSFERNNAWERVIRR
ncbi:MAG TPA: hypothetical protein VGD45_07345 [Steroidobacter sp.]|uniref:hypothetical protein n=1 Tax=Steroidobacter sp. TaxID=1978227 RepID=UPI002ED8E547